MSTTPTDSPDPYVVATTQPLPRLPEKETARPVMVILLLLVGAGLMGFTFMDWIRLTGLEEFAEFLTAVGAPMTVTQIEQEIGYSELDTTGWSDDFNGLFIILIAMSIAAISGALRRRTAAAHYGLLAAVVSALAGVLACISINTVSDLGDEFHTGIRLSGVDPSAFGIRLDVEVGLGLWLTLGTAVVGIVIGILTYLTRHRLKPGGPQYSVPVSSNQPPL